jgi:hypothetical protein
VRQAGGEAAQLPRSTLLPRPPSHEVRGRELGLLTLWRHAPWEALGTACESLYSLGQGPGLAARVRAGGAPPRHAGNPASRRTRHPLDRA